MAILLNDINYTVKEIDLVDQVIYQVFSGEVYLFSRGLNEDAEWESAEDVDQDLIKDLGNHIDDKTF